MPQLDPLDRILSAFKFVDERPMDWVKPKHRARQVKQTDPREVAMPVVSTYAFATDNGGMSVDLNNFDFNQVPSEIRTRIAKILSGYFYPAKEEVAENGGPIVQ